MTSIRIDGRGERALLDSDSSMMELENACSAVIASVRTLGTLPGCGDMNVNNLFAKLICMIIVSALTLLLGCGSHSTTRPLTDMSAKPTEPVYFTIMQQAHDLERSKKYKQAINRYRDALAESDGVDSDLRIEAKTAAHNRTAACYNKMGNTREALREFEQSLALGDVKFAPKAIAKIKRVSNPNQ